MSGFTTSMPTSFKAELAQAIHNFTITTGHVFKMALGIAAPAGTFGAATTNYSQLGTDELATATGYTRPGFAWTAAQNTTPSISGTSAFWSWSINPSWTSATFSTSGCLIQNSTAGGNAAYVGSFGGVQTVTSGTFTVLLPANGLGTSILQLT
jgi:hypothetical protein